MNWVLNGKPKAFRKGERQSHKSMPLERASSKQDAQNAKPVRETKKSAWQLRLR
jgi:hypothetical protein